MRKITLINAVPIKVNVGDIGKITIPVPPMEVQSEIVRIIDNFTELTARKQQYEYYARKIFELENVYYKQLFTFSTDNFLYKNSLSWYTKGRYEAEGRHDYGR